MPENPNNCCTLALGCCPNDELPESLHATFEVHPPEACECVNGLAVALTWDGGCWFGSAPDVCGYPFYIRIWCDETPIDPWFGLAIQCAQDSEGQTGWGGNPCSPFYAEVPLEASDIGGCCPDAGIANIIVIVTE